MKYYTMKETRAFLESICMPGGDLYDLPSSEKRFPDGGQYRFEVPGIHGINSTVSKGELPQPILDAMDASWEIAKPDSPVYFKFI